MELPAVCAYLPGGHLAWGMHFSVVVRDVKALKNPGAHLLHVIWRVALPSALAYLPGGHSV